MAREGREIARRGQERQSREATGLMPWRPFAEIVRFERDVDRMLNSFLGGRAGSLFTEFNNLGIQEPAVDIYDNENEVVVKAELPGMEAGDIEVNITDHMLILRGEKRKEEEVNEKDYYRSERVYGAFSRAVPLPAEADPETVSANFKNGVLEVHLPKTEEAKKRQIKVNVQSEESGQGQGQSQDAKQRQPEQGRQAAQAGSRPAEARQAEGKQEQGKQGEAAKR